jgi:hypothetical protein
MRLFARHENIKYSENSYNEGIYIESARIHWHIKGNTTLSNIICLYS